MNYWEEKMKYIDLHADTIYLMNNTKDYELTSNNNHIDLNKLDKGNSYLQCLAIFNLANKVESLYNATMESYEFGKELIARHDDIDFIEKYGDIAINESKNIKSIMMTLEDASGVDGKIDRINQFYEMGMKMMSLTWNFENCFGFPNSKDPEIMQSGLKDFGISAIEVMDDLGIVLDVSHLSDEGTRDLIGHRKNPVIASHSNARSICNQARNLPDDIIRMIADKGGVIGINFFDLFVSSDRESNVKNIINHIDYIKNIGGIDCISIGSDFDGFTDDGKMEIKNAGEMNKLWDGLKSRGFTNVDIEKIAWLNADRVFKEILE
jgi:membrane dipeptidase